jgi:hypothetical protein
MLINVARMPDPGLEDYGDHEMLAMDAHMRRQSGPHQEDLAYAYYTEQGWEESTSDMLDSVAREFKVQRWKYKRGKS